MPFHFLFFQGAFTRFPLQANLAGLSRRIACAVPTYSSRGACAAQRLLTPFGVGLSATIGGAHLRQLLREIPPSITAYYLTYYLGFHQKYTELIDFTTEPLIFH